MSIDKATFLDIRVAQPEELNTLFDKAENFFVDYDVPPGDLRKEWPTVIAKLEEKIVGYLSLEFCEDEEGTSHAWIRKMSMLPGFEGKGVGAKLLEFTTQYVSEHGFNEFQVWAHEPKAKRFYLKNNFSFVEGVSSEEYGNTRFVLRTTQTIPS